MKNPFYFRTSSRFSFACLSLATVLVANPAAAQQTLDTADTDADGLPDEWEMNYFGNLDQGAGDDYDQDAVPNLMEFQQGLNPTLAMSDGQTNDWEGLPVPGYLRLERWEGVPGGGLAAVFASTAFRCVEPVASLLDTAELPADYGDNHAVRLRGTLRAPVDGVYRFHIASDDQSQLWIGTSNDRFSRRLVAYVDGWTGWRQWDKYASQQSAAFTLQEGVEYWFEVVMQESSGADNLSVGWVRPGQSEIEVIPGTMPDGTVVFFGHAFSPDDLDDDGLPDEWEPTVGLSPGDDGRFNAADGGYSDWDADGFTNFEEWFTGGDPLAAGGNAGHVRRDVWSGIGGTTLADLTSSPAFAGTPGYSENVAADLDFGSRGDSYGQRVRGCVVPPHSGLWRFWIASDDASRLLLNPDSAAMTGKRKIASVSGWTAPHAFDSQTSQESDPVILSADTPYFFEILHKEGGGGDHLSVAWAFEPENWALASNDATAAQSSTWSDWSADRAIDGDTSGSLPSTTIAHTGNTQNSWWEVDFSQDRPVNRVVIFNRTDAIQNQQRLSNFRISVLDASGTELEGKNFFPSSGYVNGSMIWKLPATLTARKVKIQFLGLNLMGNGYLCLAEVQAFEWVPEAGRQIVPAACLRSAAPDPLDLDGDSLPDSWEIQYGLDPRDNGSVLAANGEYGDPDGDSVPNFLEFANGDSPVAVNGESGMLTRETWTSLSGDTLYSLVASPHYLEPANSKDTVADWQFSSRGDYYGQRLRGILTAPASGWYTFWIAGDNECRLSLSTDSSKFEKQPLASVGDGSFTFASPFTPSGNNDSAYDMYPSQRSRPVYLEICGQYFIEVLHKEHDGDDHVAVAWQVPGGAREPVPFTALQSFLYDLDDADDDDLPDTWEIEHNLDPGDNGRFNRGIEGSRGDADADRLTNREEYLLGTDPKNTDTDGDGIDDFTEARSLRSDPLDPASGAGTALADLAGSAGAPVSGEWITGPADTLLSLGRRGTVAWDFNLSTSGFRLLEVLATPQGNTWAGAPLDISLAIVRPSDSQRWSLGAFPLRDAQGTATRVLALLPWLDAGPYSVEIAISNISESRNVRIDRVRVLEPAGADTAPLNGIPDWIEDRLAAENGLSTLAGESPVSPVCLEGLARDVEKCHIAANGEDFALTAGIDKRWFADLDLPDDGSEQSLSVFFEDGVLQQDHAVSWTATNVIPAQDTTIRADDSLRLTAFPGAIPDQGAFDLSVAGPVPGDFQGFLPVSPAAALPAWDDADLSTLQAASGTLWGAWIPNPAPADAYHISANGAQTTLQLQFFDGTHTKCAGVELLQTGTDIEVRQTFARYKSGDHLGEDFESNNASSAPTGPAGYGVTALAIDITVPLASARPADNPLPHAFAAPGTFTLDATHTAPGGAVTPGSITVEVVAADFGPAFALRSGSWLDWPLPGVPAGLHLDFDSRIKAAGLPATGPGRILRVSASGDSPVHILARDTENAPVLARGTVDPHLIGDAYDTGYVEVLDTLPGGVIRGRISVVADRLPPGGYVQIQIWAGGAQFDDGTTVKNLYAVDFGPDGTAYVDIYYPSQNAISSFCAYYRLYDANGTLLSGY